MANCDYEPAGPINLSLQMGAVIIAVGGLAFMLMPLTRATSGASRSAHIKWQKRESEIEKVIAEHEEKNVDK